MRAGFNLGVVAVLCLAALLAGGCTSDDDDASNGATGSDPRSEGRPFDLEVDNIRMIGADNAAILGTHATPTDHAAAERAVNAARSTLEAFLNAQFVEEGTRFSEQPLQALLTPRAKASLTDADRAGLGVISQPVRRTFTGSADAVAQVVLRGSTTHLVHLWYAATLTLELADGTTSPVDQRGSMTFLATADGWRARAVDVDLTLPEIPAAGGEAKTGPPAGAAEGTS